MGSNKQIEHWHSFNPVMEAALLPQLLLAVPFMLAFSLVIVCIISSNRRYKKWPSYRISCWGGGVLCALAAVCGPLADCSHTNFSAHMLGHLLLGMLAPLLMVSTAPMLLFLRTLPVPQARKLSRVLKSRIIHFLNDPVVTALLNVGGLWLLYTTGLFEVMHRHLFLYVFIHIHVFIAGYLFTEAMISVDLSHRTGFVYRAIVLVLASGGHAILAKYIYAHPPGSVPAAQAEIGSMIMYYGGDIVDIIIIFIFCFQWYKAARPRGFMETYLTLKHK